MEIPPNTNKPEKETRVSSEQIKPINVYALKQ